MLASFELHHCKLNGQPVSSHKPGAGHTFPSPLLVHNSVPALLAPDRFSWFDAVGRSTV